MGLDLTTTNLAQKKLIGRIQKRLVAILVLLPHRGVGPRNPKPPKVSKREELRASTQHFVGEHQVRAICYM